MNRSFRISRLERRNPPRRPPQQPWHRVIINDGEDHQAAAIAAFGYLPERLIVRSIITPEPPDVSA